MRRDKQFNRKSYIFSAGFKTTIEKEYPENSAVFVV